MHPILYNCLILQLSLAFTMISDSLETVGKLLEKCQYSEFVLSSKFQQLRIMKEITRRLGL